jgi:hypothetical protein
LTNANNGPVGDKFNPLKWIEGHKTKREYAMKQAVKMIFGAHFLELTDRDIVEIDHIFDGAIDDCFPEYKTMLIEENYEHPDAQDKLEWKIAMDQLCIKILSLLSTREYLIPDYERAMAWATISFNAHRRKHYLLYGTVNKPGVFDMTARY